MFSITFFVTATAAPIVLLFKGEESLKAALAKYDSLDHVVLGNGDLSPMSLVEDDFGQSLQVQKPVTAMLVQDLKLAQQADIERGVHQARTQAMANDRAKTDPLLLQHMRASQQGPSVMTPFPMGRN